MSTLPKSAPRKPRVIGNDNIPLAGGVPVYCAHNAIVPIAELIERKNPKNPNKHPKKQLKRLAVVLAKAWRHPIVISLRSGLVIKGHGRIDAAALGKLTHAPVDYQQYGSEAEEVADMIADNALAELSEMDAGAVGELIASIDTGEIDLQLTGYDEKALAKMMTTAPPAVRDKGADFMQANKLAKKWGTKAGQVWQCGAHLLLCADITQKLPPEFSADLCFTDPPYNVGVNYGKLVNDKKSAAEYRAYCEAMLALAQERCKALVFTPGTANLALWYSIAAPRMVAVWVKGNQKSNNACQGINAWEPILVYGKDARIDYDVFDYPAEQRKSEGGHPVPKALDAWHGILSGSVRTAKSILDLHIGSGTSLIAAEKLGIACRGVDINPAFIAVSLERYLVATGKTPKLIK